MLKKKSIVVLILASALTGCVNQKEEVMHYRRVLHSKPAASAAKLIVPPKLTLPAALRLANDNNEQLAIAGENYLQALIAKDKAFSTFMPTVGVSAQDFQMRGFNTSALPPGVNQFFQTHYFNAPLQTQLNVNVLKDATAISAAGAYAAQRKALLLDMQSNLLLEVAQTYYQVLSDQRSVAVLRQTLRVQQANVASQTRKEKAGIALRLSVLQSQADEARTRVQLTTAENNADKGRATLAFLIGVPTLNGTTLHNAFNPPHRIPDLARLDQIALVQRQDLLAANDAVITAEKNVSAAIDEYFPSVSVDFNTFLYKEQFPSDSWWSGLFSANFPIFEGGMIYQNIRAAYSQMRQAMLQRQLLARQVIEQVRIARADWLTSVRLVRNLKTEMLAAQAAYHQAQHSYAVGVATNLDVITAQDLALSAHLAYQQARYDERVRMLDLLRQTGRFTYPIVAQLAQAARAATGVKTAAKRVD
jgi:outer membrane protein TolC